MHEMNKVAPFTYLTIYTYYDRPLNFSSQKDGDDSMYYTHLIDSQDDLDIYIELKVSPERLDAAERGETDLRTLLTEPEDGKVSLISSKNKYIERDVPFATAVEQLSSGHFPEAGVKLVDKDRVIHAYPA